MFSLRNKKNNFQMLTLIWRPGLSREESLPSTYVLFVCVDDLHPYQQFSVLSGRFPSSWVEPVLSRG